MVKTTATLSSKSQITIPAWVRRQLGLKPGARVRLRLDGERLIIEPVHRAVQELEGSLAHVYGDIEAYIEDSRQDRFP